MKKFLIAAFLGAAITIFPSPAVAQVTCVTVEQAHQVNKEKNGIEPVLVLFGAEAEKLGYKLLADFPASALVIYTFPDKDRVVVLAFKGGCFVRTGVFTSAQFTQLAPGAL